MRRLLQSIALLPFLLLAASCMTNGNTTANQAKRVVEDEYYYVKLTSDIIHKMSSPEDLKKYQFYPSSDFELYRTEEKIGETASNYGIAQKKINDYVIKFTQETPGILKQYEKVYLQYVAGYSIDNISIYFDEGDYDYLQFHIDYNRGCGYYLSNTDYGQKHWSATIDINLLYLMIRFDKDDYNKFVETAKGRTLDSRK